jgi:hypothetical protein
MIIGKKKKDISGLKGRGLNRLKKYGLDADGL